VSNDLDIHVNILTLLLHHMSIWLYENWD